LAKGEIGGYFCAGGTGCNQGTTCGFFRNAVGKFATFNCRGNCGIGYVAGINAGAGMTDEWGDDTTLTYHGFVWVK
jgi:hypothetical protein